MLRHWIRYFIIWLLSGLLYIFYVGYTSWFLFTLLCILPLCSLLLMLVGSYRLQLDIQLQEEYVQGDKPVFFLYAKTRRFPIPRICVLLTIKNHFSGEQHSQKLQISAEGKQQAYTAEIPDTHIGVISVSLEKISCYDWLGLFRISKRQSLTKEALILPKIQAVNEVLRQDVPLEEGEACSMINGLEDRFEVHPYREGEPLHHIHWKLSAKQREWMVREFSEPKQSFTNLYFECVGSLADIEAILSHVYSFSMQLMEIKTLHKLHLLRQGQLQKSYRIQDRKDLILAMKELCAQSCMESVSAKIQSGVLKQQGFYIQKDGIIPLHGGKSDE